MNPGTRNDETTPQYQAAYGARHRAWTGPDGPGYRYVKCSCGWALSGVADRPPERVAAMRLHALHVDGIAQ